MKIHETTISLPASTATDLKAAEALSESINHWSKYKNQMKNILLVSCVFPPEPVVSARTSKDIANYLVGKGHKVTVLCPIPSRPAGKMYKGYLGKMFGFGRSTGSKSFEIVRLLTFPSSKSTLLNRLLENVSFGFLSSVYMLFKCRQFDVIYLNTWPLFATAMNLWVAKLFRVPVVRSIQDVYPATLLSQDRASRNSYVLKALTRLEKLNYRLSSSNIVISDEFAFSYDKMFGAVDGVFRRPVIIQNWGDTGNLTETSDRTDRDSGDPIHELKNWCSSGFVALFGGSFSKSAATSALLEVFNSAKIRQRDIKLLLAGSGAEVVICEKLIVKYGLQDSVRILSPWKNEDTIEVLNLADVFLLPTLGEQALNSVPSKILNYLRFGRPILAVAPRGSALFNIIQESKAGVCLKIFDEDLFGHELSKLSDLDSSSRKILGDNGKSYFLNNLAPTTNLEKLCNILIDEN